METGMSKGNTRIGTETVQFVNKIVIMHTEQGEEMKRVVEGMAGIKYQLAWLIESCNTISLVLQVFFMSAGASSHNNNNFQTGASKFHL